MFIKPVDINFGVSTLVSMLMLFLILHAIQFRKPKALVFSEYPAITLTFIFQSISWISLAILYGFMRTGGEQNQYGMLLLDNLANVTMIGSAIIYARGNLVNKASTIKWLAALFVALIIWGFLFNRVGDNFGIMGKAFGIAPGVVLASLAIVGLGWVFYVRWGGWAGSAYLLITILYASLQLPAFLVFTFPDLVNIEPGSREIILNLLAGGKILLSYGFIAFALSSATPRARPDEAVYWPTHSIRAPFLLLRVKSWILSLIATIATSLATDPMPELVKKFLQGIN